MKEQDSQTPKASRSGAAAEGPIDVTPSHPVAEGRQSPGPGPVSIELLEIVGAERGVHFRTADGYNVVTRMDRWIAEALAKALAAPGAPQGGGEDRRKTFRAASMALASVRLRADKGQDFEGPLALLEKTLPKLNPAATPSQEEGPAGVDLEALGKAVTWMEWWTKQNDCSCDEHHVCGLPGRMKEMEAAKAAFRRLRAQAPAPSPRTPALEAVPADGLRMICRSYMYVHAGPLRDAANWIARVLAAKDFPQETEAWKRAHPPKGETPSEAPKLELCPTCKRHAYLQPEGVCVACWIKDRKAPAPGTPSEAAPGADDRMRERFLAAVWTEFDYRHACMTGDCPHQNGAECDAELARVAKVMVTEYLSGEDAPGTPIEKAAREAGALRSTLRDVLAEFHSLSVAIRERCAGSSVLGDILERMEEVIDGSRASLSSLPQEGAAGEGEPLPSVGGPAGQKKGEERP